MGFFNCLSANIGQIDPQYGIPGHLQTPNRPLMFIPSLRAYLHYIKRAVLAVLMTNTLDFLRPQYS
jgi:hypothetical protein